MAQPSAGMVPYGTSVIHSDRIDVSKAINHDNIKGKTIIITGGASGIGQACFREWASHGANVIIGDINEKAGAELVAEIRQSSGNPNHHFIPLDVIQWSSQVSFFKQAAGLSPHGGIDCVMANAGIADGPESMAFEDAPDYSKMDNPPPPKMRTLEINLTGVMYTTNLALSYLSRNPGSEKCNPNTHAGKRDRHLILVSSIAGLAALPSQPLYVAAKHGVVGLFRTLRLTTPITNGIRVNMLNPCELRNQQNKSPEQLLMSGADFIDTPILGPMGAIILAGGGMSTMADVVEATTRLVADQGIIGRALMIGTKSSPEQANAVGIEHTTEGQAIWDVYSDDFEQTDLFTRRIIGVTNLVTVARGWSGMWADLGKKMSQSFWKTLGH